MTSVVKLTRPDWRTKNDTPWGPGVEHTAPGNGMLCSSAYLHAYADEYIAALMAPGDVPSWWQDAIAWRADADVERDNGIKLGCTRLRTIERIALPKLTNNQRAECSIRLAMEAYPNPDFIKWGEHWLDGKDRTVRAASNAADAAWAVGATGAVYAARAAAEAAWASMYAAAPAYVLFFSVDAVRAATTTSQKLDVSSIIRGVLGVV